MLRIGVLVSGGGTNFQAILDAIERDEIPDSRIVLVVSSKSDAYALTRAEKAGIPREIVRREDFGTQEAFDEALVEILQHHQIDLVLLAGFMSILGSHFIKSFENRIMNIHPALVPAFSGPGYYGLKVHKAALNMGVKVTGATVHFVTEEVDGGPIILQKPVMIMPGETAESLQKRVMEQADWQIYPQAVRLFAEGRLVVEGRRVSIKQ